ncbi:MAG: hypothetical protein HUJ57_01825, partial [Erysipelotrichaceae bacterium]|nr:hypothetical protein [Erysipelotrichaceae bacterium]
LDVTKTIKNKAGDTVTAMSFANVYEASGNATLQATKTVNNQPYGGTMDFTFKASELGTGKTWQKFKTGKGTISFDQITYSINDLGTHTYKIEEIGTAPSGWTFDTTVKYAKVFVEDNGDGTLKTTVTYYSDEELTTQITNASFNNKHELFVTLEAKKHVNSVAADGECFKFEVYDSYDSATETFGNLVDTGFNNGKEDITFNQLTIDVGSLAPGTSTEKYFYIKEDASYRTEAGWDHDTTIFKATVKVTADADGNLSSDVSYSKVEDGSTVNDAVFNNLYSTDIQLEAKKHVNSVAADGECFKFDVYDSYDKTSETFGTLIESGYNNGKEDIT